MNKIKELRINNKISQTELAKALGTSQRTISNYESGNNQATEDVLIKLADYFDVSVDMIVGRARPHDLPSSTTEKQKQVVKEVLELSDEQCNYVSAYITGLKNGEEKRADTINKLKGNL